MQAFAGSDSGFKDGKAAEARFYSIWGAAVDGKGDFLVADSSNYSIRLVDKSGKDRVNRTCIGVAGEVRTLAGTGTKGFKDGPCAQAQFNNPYGVAVGTGPHADLIFVAETTASASSTARPTPSALPITACRRAVTRMGMQARRCSTIRSQSCTRRALHQRPRNHCIRLLDLSI